MRLRRELFPILLLTSGLAIVLAIYSLGWSGTLHFDDGPNLDGLYSVSDVSSGLLFSSQGISGPTGRPLSLATFAFQAAHWPDPRPFLIFNSILHIVNGFICYLFLMRLVHWFEPRSSRAEWFAASIALIWAASPFLSSASLIVVQRMTGLSAFFTLLFLWIYLITRERYQSGRFRDNVHLAIIAGAGTVLAGLAKENGFLLPIFLLLIERLLVPTARAPLEPLNQRFSFIVLVLPVAGILVYLLTRGLSPGGFELRDFSLAERLLSQPLILWDYIRHLLVPVANGITPFHDDWQHSEGLFNPFATFLALGGLIVLLGAAWFVRRSMPIVAFGVFFFFGGHLLESSTIPLELYFPHRNYVPAIGLYLSVGYLLYTLVQINDRWRKPAALLSATYFALFLAVLGSGTSLWGNQALAAEIWFTERQGSIRAAQYLYNFYADQGDSLGARHINEISIRNHPGDPLFSLQALGVCDTDDEIFEAKVERAAMDLLSQPAITTNIANTLQHIAVLAGTSDCEQITLARADRLIAAAFTREDRFADQNAHQILWMAKAQLADHQGDYKNALMAMEQAAEINPNLDAALLIAYYHVEMGNVEKAIKHLEGLLSSVPVGFPENLAWRGRLRPLLEDLREYTEGDRPETGPSTSGDFGPTPDH